MECLSGSSHSQLPCAMNKTSSLSGLELLLILVFLFFNAIYYIPLALITLYLRTLLNILFLPFLSSARNEQNVTTLASSFLSNYEFIDDKKKEVAEAAMRAQIEASEKKYVVVNTC